MEKCGLAGGFFAGREEICGCRGCPGRLRDRRGRTGAGGVLVVGKRAKTIIVVELNRPAADYCFSAAR